MLRMCTYVSVMDILTCEVSLHCKVKKGGVMDSDVFGHVSRLGYMLHDASANWEDGHHEISEQANLSPHLQFDFISPSSMKA